VVEKGFQSGVIVRFYDTYALAVGAYNGDIVFAHVESFFRGAKIPKIHESYAKDIKDLNSFVSFFFVFLQPIFKTHN
jgi:hypothetical protein